MALLQQMRQQQDPDAQQDMAGINDPDAAGDAGSPAAKNPDQQGDAQGGNQLQQVVNGMMEKLFPDKDLQSLVDLLRSNASKTTKPVVDSIVGGVVGLLKQGQQQGKSLPVKVVMMAVIPILIKIAQGVEQEDEQRASSLLAELISSVGQQLAIQGSKAGVMDQSQVAEMKQLVNAFVAQVSKHFSDNGNPQAAPQMQDQQPQQQPQQPVMQ